MKTLQDKTAVVTGAASGIGRATAIAFAESGCNVVAADVDTEGLDETRRLVVESVPERRIATEITDVSDPDAVERLAESTVERFDKVHIVVNNAGINVTGRFEEHTLEDFRRTFDVNLWGVIHGCRSFLPHLKRADQGHIVNISSVFGIIGAAGQAAYTASKFAVRGLTETLHEELADTSVDVTVVHPGCVNTDIVQDATIRYDGADDDIRGFFADNGCAPSVVANHIVEAVRQRKHRLLVTPEAHAADVARRVAPTAGNRLANGLMARLLGIELT